MLSDHIKQDIFLAFQTGGCLLLYESSAESSCMSFLHYFHAAISKTCLINPKFVLLYMVIKHRFDSTKKLHVCVEILEAVRNVDFRKFPVCGKVHLWFGMQPDLSFMCNLHSFPK